MILLEIIKAFIIGVIQGITEWLPISSTGHMILADEFIKLNITPEFKEMFFVVIQLGSILAVVVLFFNKLNPISNKKTESQKKDIWILWSKVLIASIPAAVVGLLFDDIIESVLFNYVTVAIMLIVYGILFIIIENRNKKRTPTTKDLQDLSYKRAFLIGAFQMLALIPGTSRSGSTILGATLIGTSRNAAAEFSFFMAIPVMLGASCLKVFKYIKDGVAISSTELAILVTGVVVAFVVSIFAIKMLMGYIKKHDFKVFGYYRIALGIIVLSYFLIR